MMMQHPFMQFVNVVKQFDHNKVLDGVNLSVYKGEILAIIGKSGTGKSVLLKHMIGLIQYDSGEILVENIPVHSLSAAQIKKLPTLSYMFQENALFDSMSVYDNIALPLVETTRDPKEKIKEKVLTRMEQLGLLDAGKKYPAQLSGGMRKRVAFARALVTDPMVVLFDEPTTGLDPVRKRNIHEMIHEYQQQFGFTAVIVTHDLPEIFEIAQRVAMLDNGKITFEGTLDDVFSHHGKVIDDFVKGIES